MDKSKKIFFVLIFSAILLLSVSFVSAKHSWWHFWGDNVKYGPNTGQLSISSEPGKAQVYINKSAVYELIGNTGDDINDPLLIQVAERSYYPYPIKISKAGYKDHYASVYIESGKTTKYHAVLSPNQVCGNGIVQGTEQCDDGNAINTDVCTNQCRNAMCGDNLIRTGVEVCDGNSVVCIKDGKEGTQKCNSQCNGFDSCVTESVTCTDSDGGKVPEKKGIANNTKGEREEDRCLNATDLIESFCLTNGSVANSYVDRPFITCSNGCVDGACKPAGGACVDIDNDGSNATGAGCGVADCNDANANIRPGKAEICGDGIDQDCSGADLACSLSIITITSPTNGQVLTSSLVNVNYAESGNLAGVDHVHLQLDSQPEIRDLDNNGDYNFTGVSNGAHSVRAFLADINHNQLGNAVTVSFTVNVASVCGNNIIESGETCDDGNVRNGDRCSNICKKEVADNNCTDSDGGDVNVTKGTITLINNTDNKTSQFTDYCSSNTKLIEHYCDTSNEVRTKIIQCSSNPNSCIDGACKKTEEVCGDGILNGNEICDDGSLNGQPNRCNLQCSGITISVCGNNAIEAGEQCDDGNNLNGDGCSSSCLIENTPADCKLIGANWSVAETVRGFEARENQLIGLNVTGENCNGLEVAFDVIEKDFSSPDDPVRVFPPNVLFFKAFSTGPDYANTQWKVEGTLDEFFTKPEYYFIAKLVKDPSKSIKSELLKVV